MTIAITKVDGLQQRAASAQLCCAWCRKTIRATPPAAAAAAAAGFGVCDECIPVALNEVLARLTDLPASNPAHR